MQPDRFDGERMTTRAGEVRMSSRRRTGGGAGPDLSMDFRVPAVLSTWLVSSLQHYPQEQRLSLYCVPATGRDPEK